MPNLPPVYVRHETKARLDRLAEETRFPISHVLALAVETLDEAYDSLEEMIAVLQRQAGTFTHNKRGRKPKGGE